MKDKPGSDLASQMKTARELLDAGEVRDALVLAMDVLWRELGQLQGTLRIVEERLPQNGVAAAGPAEPDLGDFIWPEFPSQLLH